MLVIILIGLILAAIVGGVLISLKNRQRDFPTLKKLGGTVSTFKAVSRRCVQFEFTEHNKVIELTVSDTWVIKSGDHVLVTGEEASSGKFVAYAYINHTKGVSGAYSPSDGEWSVFMGLFFFWAIFPLFTFVPSGLEMIVFENKVRRAVAMLNAKPVNS